MSGLRSALVVVLLVALTTASLLTVLLVLANPQALDVGGGLELAAAMLAIALIVNGAFLVLLLAMWPLLVRLAPRWLRGRWTPYVASGLLALNIAWILWNRLAMVHQWASARPFITWPGIWQSVLLVALALAVVLGGTRLAAGRPGRSGAAAALTIAVALTAVLLAWNRSAERVARTYPLEAIRTAAGGTEQAVATSGTVGGPVVVLALDGMCWSVMKPLMEAGLIPNFARLVREGSFGYLDNFDESLSPAVWTSIYTGRTSRVHRIHGYEKMVLPRSGDELTDLLPMKPSMDTLYGFRYLLKYLEWLGLWRLEFVGSDDRAVPAIWEILTFFEQPIVVVNPLVNTPVQPVDGAMVVLAHRPSPASLHPSELATIWNPEVPPDQSGRSETSFQGIRRWLHEEVDFSIDLVHTFEPDLAIYYSHFVDSVTHSNWDFHSRGRFLMTDLPRSLTDGRWEALLLENREDRLVRAYVEMDRAVGTFVSAFPHATYVVVSDHGWTFSGYEHFGSPDGIIILAGPGIHPGRLEDATVLDVVPTVLALIQAPISRELPGRVLTDVVEGDAGPTYVSDYPTQVRLRADASEPEASLDPEEIERLKALGYIQ